MEVEGKKVPAMYKRKVDTGSVHPLSAVLLHQFLAASRGVVFVAVMGICTATAVIFNSPMERSPRRLVAVDRCCAMLRGRHMRHSHSQCPRGHKTFPRTYCHVLCLLFHLGASDATLGMLVWRVPSSRTRSCQFKILVWDPVVM